MALVLFAVGCRRPAATAARPAYLVVTADTAGWIVPCGCTANQSGGLLRRGTYLAGLRRSADVLYADAGGAPAGTSAYQLAKFQFVLDGEAALGIAVHNLGQCPRRRRRQADRRRGPHRHAGRSSHRAGRRLLAAVRHGRRVARRPAIGH
jgi:hypothetical protein